MGKFEEIINNGKKNGKSVVEVNKELKEAGANFHINPDHTESGWTQEEMDEGFIPAKGTPNVTHLFNLMKHNANMAGKSKEYWTIEGKYEITWDENGTPVKAVRKN